MIGMVTSCTGKQTLLPALLQWNIKRTDGEPCDSFSVQFLCGKTTKELLEQATEFRATEKGRVVFTGIVDDFELRLGKEGAIAELTGRGMAARLMDMQTPAAEYVSAQLEDILNAYVRPCGITKIEADEMPPVRNFVVQTGATCYQALAGFCRHSAEIFPRFLADGTLVLRKEAAGSSIRLGSEILTAQYVRNRYGVAARQVLINTRNGSYQAADYAGFQALGGTRVQYAGRTGDKIRATFRTAKQRLDDTKRDEKLLYVTVSGEFSGRAAGPGCRFDRRARHPRNIYRAGGAVRLRRDGRDLHADFEVKKHVVIKTGDDGSQSGGPSDARYREHRRAGACGCNGCGKAAREGDFAGRLLLESGGDRLRAGGQGERAVSCRYAADGTKGLQPGEVMLFSKGASVKVMNDGEIHLAGDVYVEGDLYVNGQKMEVP